MVDIKQFLVQREGKDFVLYAGLLALAHDRGLTGITTTLIQVPSELNGMVAICHATVQLGDGTFSGIGDASPGNVTRMMAPHTIRMAETRAKARALRDAVNVGVTALEELGEDAPAAAADGPQRGSWPRDGQGVRRPAERPPTRPVVDDSAKPEPTRQECLAYYSQLFGIASSMGLDDVRKVPADADLNTIIDMGTALRDRIDEARRAKGAGR